MAQMVADAFKKLAEVNYTKQCLKILKILNLHGLQSSEYLRYSVGRVEGTFELDTEATDMSPEDLDMRGVGEGWGGMFSVETN
jgi:hypothetical protein